VKNVNIVVCITAIAVIVYFAASAVKNGVTGIATIPTLLLILGSLH